MLGLTLLAGVPAAPAAAQTDPADDAFLAAVSEAGLLMGDPAAVVDLGRRVCPMLSEPGQRSADVAAKVAEAGGMPLRPATMFTGLAISIFCPTLVSQIGSGIASGASPVPLPLPGF